MSILQSKECPKCGCPDGLTVCTIAMAVNCYNCMEFIRALTKEEKKKVEIAVGFLGVKKIKEAPDCRGCRR